jgi:hypothetical protein
MSDKRNEPAFPTGKVYDDDGAVSIKDSERPGMTLRQYAAIKAMQGLVMGASNEILLRRTISTFAEQAVLIADTLLAALEDSR